MLAYVEARACSLVRAGCPAVYKTRLSALQAGTTKTTMQFSRRFRLSALAFTAAFALSACASHGLSAVPQPSAGVSAASQANVQASCGDPAPGEARCYALFRTDQTISTLSTGSRPAGFGPSDLQAAYNVASLTSTHGAAQTVAIVDAYDDATAEHDLGVYRAQYGIGPCTTANGCFKKLNQNGVQGSYPVKDASWSQEISLDLDMVSAICPKCRIMLVEASSPTFANLGSAVNAAALKGANVISNSYGSDEFAPTDAAYSHAHVVITASAGDNGTGATQPCSFATVVCVGGTTLWRASNARGWSETAWSGTGSGCSSYVVKPSWQTDTLCKHRSESDVSAVADPNTGVAVYDSTAYLGASGWMVFGGTSASSPIVAGVYGLAGNASAQNAASGIWTHRSALHDVTYGSNGTCAIRYICNAAAGYDGPTGWGTPNGIGAF